MDGELILACDHLAAFIEACISIDHGITSPQLREGIDYLYEKYSNKEVTGINSGQLFGHFGLT